jgi:dTDP-4-dehydrorhamnose 3,5-epimerase
MIFTPLALAGAFLVDLELREDGRGFFARTWAREEFEAHRQCSLSFNHRRGTLRGLHYQRAPHAEAKLVRCTRGGIHDVIVDLRPDSSSYRQWLAVELTAENRTALYVPEGFAHGFQTLVDATEVFYQVSQSHWPAAEGGIRWDDPAVGIEWPPADERIISERDRLWPDLGADPA